MVPMTNMPTAALNLARKYRPQRFENVIGQDISVRMLKNSLYANKLFPVYLFEGERGCGKTSTARIFAAAVNCHKREQFQQDPTVIVPCGDCTSCQAMRQAHHPDFVEIDAASHTGVDNVRQIIETSSYVPLSGYKKIYLIDEAHMLSKAAFNAFLKILEEPPISVLFILATTELHKIPSTVLSRCFQLTFSSVAPDALIPHLIRVCEQETINIDHDALTLIVHETGGCVRDTLNIIEQVRFSSPTITVDAVLSSLGKVSNQTVINLISCIIEQNIQALMHQLTAINFARLNPSMIWAMIITCCKSLLWIKYGCNAVTGFTATEINALQEVAKACSLNRLYAIMQLLWHQEQIFIQTNKKHDFLEFVLIQLCGQQNIIDLEALLTMLEQENPLTTSPLPAREEARKEEKISFQATSSASLMVNREASPEKGVIDKLLPQETESQPADASKHAPWEQFIQDLINSTNDGILNAIMLQARFIKENDNGTLIIALNKHSKLFIDKIDETKQIWAPLINKYFPSFRQFSYEQLNTSEQTVPPKQPMRSEPAPLKQPPSPINNTKPFTLKATTGTKSVNQDFVLNKEEWPLTSLLLEHFPGKIKKISN